LTGNRTLVYDFKRQWDDVRDDAGELDARAEALMLKTQWQMAGKCQ